MTTSASTRVIAIDWSGARLPSGQSSKIWLSEVCDGSVTRLEACWTREGVIRHLIQQAKGTPDLVVGLDFAFSFPAWYCRASGALSHLDFWRLVEREGEKWLHKDSRISPPFWGWSGSKRPPEIEVYRATERDVRKRYKSVHSVFALSGPGAVGPGSIRGIPFLLQLHQAGFSIWPFDSPTAPLAIEIFPRTLTGDVKKSSPCARYDYLGHNLPELRPFFRGVATGDDNAFDAAVSAIVMARHLPEIQQLKQPSDFDTLLEGRIWEPSRAHDQ